MSYYDNAKPDCKINVLGTDYDAFLNVMANDDPMLLTCDGYCDWTVKKIVIAGITDEEEHADFSYRHKSNIRHELIHAFLYESGIDGNSTWDIEGQNHPEQMVAWIAMQFPKLMKAFIEAGAV